jgi:hypothetical protein
MSYFNTLNQFVDNAQQEENHLEAIKYDLVSSKVADVRDQFNQHLSSVENFGQATLGASAGYHMGRKIYKKIKEKYGKDPAKDIAKDADGGGAEGAGAEGEGAEEGEGLKSINDANATEYQNPLFNKEDLDADKAAGGSEPEQPVEAGFQSNAAVESAETGERAELVSSDADALKGRLGGLLDRIQQTTGVGGGAKEIKTQEPSQDPDQEPPEIKPSGDASGDAAVEVNEDMDGFKTASQVSRRAIAEAGGTEAKQLTKKLGIKYAEDGAIDLGETALDAIPVIGEIAGVVQIFHGLFHEHKERLKERAKEAADSQGILAGGSLVASGGLDLTKVAPQVGNLSGLV